MGYEEQQGLDSKEKKPQNESSFEQIGSASAQSHAHGSGLGGGMGADLIQGAYQPGTQRESQPSALSGQIQAKHNDGTDIDLENSIKIIQNKEIGWQVRVEKLNELMKNHKSGHDRLSKSKQNQNFTDEERCIERAQKALYEEINAPYNHMAQNGMMWNHKDYKDSTRRIDRTFGWITGGGKPKEGREYFDRLSGKNMESMAEEKNDQKDQESIDGLIEKIKTTIQDQCVLNHYTTHRKLGHIQENGSELKSFNALKGNSSKEQGQAEHNTQPYDEHGLANTGFVFCFIESANAEFRKTKFGNEQKESVPAECRISMSLEESGLLSNGWVMLNDFGKLAYPNGDNLKVSRKTDNGKNRKKHQEKLMNAKNEHGIGNHISEQVNLDDNTQIVYKNEDGSEKTKKYPSHIFNNVLVGSDILSGLATRAALEIMRISEVSPEKGAEIQTYTGNALIELIFKDLFRPQAMIPNGFRFDGSHIQQTQGPSAEEAGGEGSAGAGPAEGTGD